MGFLWQMINADNIHHNMLENTVPQIKVSRMAADFFYLSVVSRAVFRASFVLVDWYGCPKKYLKKQNVTLLKLTCLFLKRKFSETNKDFSINYNNKCGNIIFSFNSSVD